VNDVIGDARHEVPRSRAATLAVHGGDLAAIGRRFGIDPATLLDFSANLNPLGPPTALLRELRQAACDVADLARYPDPDARALREALAAHLAIDAEAIVVGNGAAALFATVFATLGTRHAVVPTPAFSEYAHALANARAEMHALALDPSDGFALDPARVASALRRTRADAIVLTNPHNPSGTSTSRARVGAIVEEARACDAVTIVDEAFVEYAAETSVTAEAAASDGSLVTIRSLTKFYAVPALRVGYAVAQPSLARRMRAALPSWPVTTLAARALTVALDDDAYAKRTLANNAGARERLRTDLAALGYQTLPSAANFLFVTIPPSGPRAPELAERLARDARIVVRDCSSYRGCEAGAYVRVAVRSDADNARLVAALARMGF